MIKIEVTRDKISIHGHAMYDDYGKDIVCAAVSSTVTTSIECIASLDEKAVDVDESSDELTITVNKHDEITDKLIATMIELLKEIEMEYPKNIKITNKEE